MPGLIAVVRAAMPLLSAECEPCSGNEWQGMAKSIWDTFVIIEEAWLVLCSSGEGSEFSFCLLLKGDFEN